MAEDDATRMMREHRVRVTVKENYKYQKLSTLSGVTRDALPSKRLNCRKVSFSFGKKESFGERACGATGRCNPMADLKRKRF